jgi:LCP family protein required for cell wall assembly
MATIAPPPQQRRAAPPRPPVSVATARAQAAALRRAILLVLATLLVPGSAQRLAGNRRVGSIALRVWLVALVLGGLLVLIGTQRPSVLVTLASSAFVLTLAKTLVAVLGAGWLALLLDAWRLGRPPQLSRRGRLGLTALTATVFLLVAGLLSTAMHMLDVQRDLVAALFSQRPSIPAVDGRYNVLLLGGDAGADREGMRPDSLTVVSVDAATGHAVLVGIPRNLLDVPFPEGSGMAEAWPDGFDCGDACTINAVYTWAEDHPEDLRDAEDPGIEATRLAAEGVTGLTIPYTIEVDMAGFSQLVDAMGGVTVDVGKPIPIGGGSGPVEGYIEPGVQKLDGFHALWFARSREESSDYERMVRQKCLMSSLAHQADPLTVLSNYEALAKASAALVRTDIPTADLPELLKVAQLAKGQAIDAVSLVPPLIDPVRPDYDDIHAMVTDLLAGEPPVDAAGGGGDGTVGNASSSAAAAVQGSVPATATPAADADSAAGETVTDGAATTAPVVPTQTAAELGLVCQAV